VLGLFGAIALAERRRLHRVRLHKRQALCARGQEQEQAHAHLSVPRETVRPPIQSYRWHDLPRFAPAHGEVVYGDCAGLRGQDGAIRVSDAAALGPRQLSHGLASLSQNSRGNGRKDNPDRRSSQSRYDQEPATRQRTSVQNSHGFASIGRLEPYLPEVLILLLGFGFERSIFLRTSSNSTFRTFTLLSTPT